ncbi:hypothetical protein VN12_22795 [Pirellula sp. SH-Sr6A]|nr:hypothetical protein VN12_22795 [Pirellula sp. SH-Sr6A]
MKSLGKSRFQNVAAQNPTRAEKRAAHRQRTSKTNAPINAPIYRVTTLSPFGVYRVTSKTPEKI